MSDLGKSLWAAYKERGSTNVKHDLVTIHLTSGQDGGAGNNYDPDSGKLNVTVGKDGRSFQQVYDDVDEALTHELTHEQQICRDENATDGYVSERGDDYVLQPLELEAFYNATRRRAARARQPFADFLMTIDTEGKIYHKLAKMAVMRHPRMVFANDDFGNPLTAEQFLKSIPKQWAWTKSD